MSKINNDKLTEIYDLCILLANHDLLKVERNYLLHNTREELGQRIGIKLSNNGLMRDFGGRLYVSSESDRMGNIPTSINYKKKYSIDTTTVDDNTVLTFAPTPTEEEADELINRLNDKIRDYDRCYDSMKHEVSQEFNMSLDDMLNGYQEAYNLLNPALKRKEYKEFRKQWLRDIDNTAKELWNRSVYEIEGDGYMQQLVDIPQYVIPIMYELVHKPGKPEKYEIDFDKAFEILDNFTKDNGSFEKLPRLAYLQEQFANNKLEKTRANMFFLFEEVFFAYCNIVLSDAVDEVAQDLIAPNINFTEMYDITGVWREGDNTALWTIKELNTGFALNKIDFKDGQPPILTKYDVFIKILKNDNLYFGVISPSKMIDTFKRGKYSRQEASYYLFKCKDGPGTPSSFELKFDESIVPDSEDFLKLGKLDRITDSTEIEKYKKRWKNEKERIHRRNYLSVKLSLTAILLNNLYIGSFDNNDSIKGCDKGHGHKFYYRINKFDDGKLANTAYNTDFGQSVGVARVFDKDGNQTDYINFDFAVKMIKAPQANGEEPGITITSDEETCALNSLLAIDRDNADLEKNFEDIFDPFEAD